MIHHVDITSVIILFFKKTFFYMHFFAHSRSTLRSIRVIDGSCNPLLHPRSGLCFPLPWVGFWVRATPHPTTPQAVQFVPTMAVVSLCAHIQCLARNAPRISVFQVVGGGGCVFNMTSAALWLPLWRTKATFHCPASLLPLDSIWVFACFKTDMACGILILFLDC